MSTSPTDIPDSPPPDSRRRLSVDWIAVLVAGLLVVAVATGLLPVIPW